MSTWCQTLTETYGIFLFTAPAQVLYCSKSNITYSRFKPSDGIRRDKDGNKNLQRLPLCFSDYITASLGAEEKQVYIEKTASCMNIDIHVDSMGHNPSTWTLKQGRQTLFWTLHSRIRCDFYIKMAQTRIWLTFWKVHGAWSAWGGLSKIMFRGVLLPKHIYVHCKIVTLKCTLTYWQLSSRLL